MKPCLARWSCVGLFLAVVFSAAWVQGAEPRPVADEFQEALTRISALVPAKSLEALEFPPREVRFVRLAIQETSGRSQPGIDELEIFGPDGKENLALAERGAVASASSLLSGYRIHQIKHLNDGLYGNDHSWIAATSDRAWVQVELPKPATVASVLVTRDRTGKFRDRIPEVFEVLVSQDGQQWQSVAKRERTGPHRARRLPYFQVGRLPEKTWNGFLQYAFLRERATWNKIPADDHLSPLQVDRPAVPGGAPYWSRIARLAPLERVLVQFDDLIARLARQGWIRLRNRPGGRLTAAGRGGS